MFNLSGSELIFLLLIALVVLGPEKLPEAVRKFGKTYGEFKKMTSGFQNELRSALDEPMREMRDTAEAMRKAANFAADDDAAPQQPRAVQAGETAPAGDTAPAGETVGDPAAPEQPAEQGRWADGEGGVLPEATDRPAEQRTIADEVASE